MRDGGGCESGLRICCSGLAVKGISNCQYLEVSQMALEMHGKINVHNGRIIKYNTSSYLCTSWEEEGTLATFLLIQQNTSGAVQITLSHCRSIGYWGNITGVKRVKQIRSP